MSLIVRKELQSTRIEDNQCTEASLQSAVEAAEESCGESGAECIFLVEAVLEMRLVWAFKYSLKMLPIATRSISTQFSVI